MTAPESRFAVLGPSLQAGDSASAKRLAFADLNNLLAPIDPTEPAGESLRYDLAFDQLRDARREEDASTPQGIWARDLKRADWAAVHTLGSDLLARRSKDLQIAAWLLEAWIKLHGFAGARMGFSLLLGLSEAYWSDLHPAPDGSDLTARTATFDWINDRLQLRILDVPVTRPMDVDGRAWTWGERREAFRRETLAKREPKSGKPAPKADEALSFAKFAISAGSTPRAFLVECDEDLAAAIASARTLQQLLDQRCGSAAPSLTKITELMAEIRQFVGTVLAEGRQPVADEHATAPAPTGAPSATGADTNAPDSLAVTPPAILDAVMQQTPAAASAPVDYAAARTEAYRKLGEAADTLMRLEPHSPAPYLVRRAITWGGMSLAELMRHFIESGYDLNSLYAMLGMGES